VRTGVGRGADADKRWDVAADYRERLRLLREAAQRPNAFEGWQSPSSGQARGSNTMAAVEHRDFAVVDDDHDFWERSPRSKYRCLRFDECTTPFCERFSLSHRCVEIFHYDVFVEEINRYAHAPEDLFGWRAADRCDVAFKSAVASVRQLGVCDHVLVQNLDRGDLVVRTAHTLTMSQLSAPLLRMRLEPSVRRPPHYPFAHELERSRPDATATASVASPCERERSEERRWRRRRLRPLG
jgi:hypothetical protein